MSDLLLIRGVKPIAFTALMGQSLDVLIMAVQRVVSDGFVMLVERKLVLRFISLFEGGSFLGLVANSS